MKTNQAFKKISDISGPHVARIITDAIPNISKFRLWWILHQLKKDIPVAKIIHNKWFYGLKFYTNKWTLDPRPDTETLVYHVINDYKHKTHISIADLGTGSGCIICAVAKNINASGIGLEKSYRATIVARKNINNLNLNDKISVHRGDFNDPNSLPQNSFDVITSNPPYIAFGDTRVDASAMHDPKTALFAPDNGLAAYKQIAKNAKNWLKPDGKIYLEIGIDMEKSVTDIFTDNGWKFVKSAKDFGGITRVLVFAL